MIEVLNENIIYGTAADKPSSEHIARNGVILGFVKVGSFGTEIKHKSIGAEVIRNGESFDDICSLEPLSTDKKSVYLEGEKNIYQLDKAAFKQLRKGQANPLAVFDDPVYSPDREWTEHEMDTLL